MAKEHRNKRIPKPSYHKASGQAVIRLDGRDIYLGPYRSRKARAKYRRIISEWTAGIPRDDEQIDYLYELILQYKRHVYRYYCREGRETPEVFHQRTALRYVLPYANLTIEKFGPLKLKACRQAMIDAGLARKTINGHVNRIRRMFAWAAEDELIDPAHPHRLACVGGLRRGQGGVEPKKRRPVGWESVVAVRDLVGRRVWAMVQLQWLTGMRSGEMIQMRTCDIDTSGNTWYYRPLHHKTEHRGHDRLIALGPQAREILRPWLRKKLDEYIFSPAEAVDESRQATIAERTARGGVGNHKRPAKRKRWKPGSTYTNNSYRRAIVRACQEAGIARWTPHQLRHSFATRVRREFSLDAARAALGHSSAEVTLDYAELDRDKATEVARKIG